MSDLISRQAAIRWVKAECNPYGKPTLDYESGKRVMKHLEQMPSSQPEQRWIPCSERLPEDYQYFYATCRSNIDNRENWVIEGWYTPWRGFNPPPLVAEGKAEIIAWMPKEFPEPYREDDK